MRLPFGLSPKKRRDPNAVRYGDLYPRAVASGIDLTLLFLVLNNFFIYMGGEIYKNLDPHVMQGIHDATTASAMLSLMLHSNFAVLWLANAIFQVLVIGVLYVAVQLLWDTTPGKWLMGLKVVRVGTLQPIAKWRYFLRFFAYVVSAFPLMLGVFWSAFNKQRRGWHDYIAGTVVIHTRPEYWYLHQIKKLYRRLRKKHAVAPIDLPVERLSADTPQNTDSAAP